MEYLRNNFRPLQDLDNRKVFKSAVKDAWQRDLTEVVGSPHGTEASRGKLYFLHGMTLSLSFYMALLVEPNDLL